MEVEMLKQKQRVEKKGLLAEVRKSASHMTIHDAGGQVVSWPDIVASSSTTYISTILLYHHSNSSY